MANNRDGVRPIQVGAVGFVMAMAGVYSYLDARRRIHSPVLREVVGGVAGLMAAPMAGGEVIPVGRMSLWAHNERRNAHMVRGMVVAATMVLTEGYVFYKTRKLLRVPIVRDVGGFIVSHLIAGAVGGLAMAAGMLWMRDWPQE